MNRLRCEDCGTRFYSAAARLLAERGERCSVCGGRLRYEEEISDGPRIAVVPPAPDDGGDAGGDDDAPA